MKKLFILFVIVIGVLLVPAYYSAGTTNMPPVQVSRSVVASDWVKGQQMTGLSIVEYSDFQCPACSAYFPLVQQMMAEFGDSIRFAYRHFPLKSIHANAEMAARATEAAGIQGKFWEMHDVVFLGQNDWEGAGDVKKVFSGYAEKLGLSVSQFTSDIDSAEVAQSVNDDYAGGIQLGVNATPTFFVNGKKIQNPRNYADLKALIEYELEKK